MHRVVRALVEGQDTVAAKRLARMPEPDVRDCHPDDLPYWAPHPGSTSSRQGGVSRGRGGYPQLGSAGRAVRGTTVVSRTGFWLLPVGS